MRTGAWLEIDLDALRHNYLIIEQRLSFLSKTKIFPVIKANAYGHGMTACAEVLIDCGASALCVAFAGEAVQLRTQLSEEQSQVPIVVLVPPLQQEADLFCETRAHFMATDVSVVRHFSAVAKKRGITLSAHLYIDTGMRRDGIAPEIAVDFMRACEGLPGINFVGLCTHFATAEDPDVSFFLEQKRRFQSAIAQLANVGYVFQHIHAANSAALFLNNDAYFSAVRPGLALYGCFSTPGMQNEWKPVLSLKTRVVSIRRAKKGESIGYGRHFFCQRDTNIATIAIGYGDGWSRQLSQKIDCLIQGKRFPFVGWICMDQCMVDVGEDPVCVGDEVVLIGRQKSELISATELAQNSGTIPYEILTSLSPHLVRRYRRGLMEVDNPGVGD